MLAKLSPVPIVKILPAVFQLFESRPVRLLSAAGFFYALEPGTVMNQFGEVLRIAGALGIGLRHPFCGSSLAPARLNSDAGTGPASSLNLLKWMQSCWG